MSGSMQFMALYQLADTASVDVTFFLDGSNYSNDQVMACLNSLVTLHAHLNALDACLFTGCHDLIQRCDCLYCLLHAQPDQSYVFNAVRLLCNAVCEGGRPYEVHCGSSI